MALKALILDVDGTIAETADVKRAAFNQAFAEIGLDWVWGRAVFQEILAGSVQGGEAAYYAHLRQPEIVNNMSKNGALEQIHRRQQTIYRNLLEAGAAQLRPGIARLMGEAMTGRVKLALCSIGPRLEFETLIFNRFGFDMLNAITASVAAEDLKTHSLAAAYRQCLAKLSVSASDCLAIDDSGAGCAAAARLGMTVIATPGHYWQGESFRDAELVLSDLGHPAAPFSVLRGDAKGIGHVTLAALNLGHGRATATLRHASAA
jgi:beta-phosphoglucomutase-like phosphatase (HAD superfamily)